MIRRFFYVASSPVVQETTAPLTSYEAFQGAPYLFVSATAAQNTAAATNGLDVVDAAEIQGQFTTITE